LFWFAIGSGKMRSQENLTIGKNVISWLSILCVVS
jgi:hypothetical protein